MRSHWIRDIAVAGAIVFCGVAASWAKNAEATPAQILSIKPAQAGVQCDTPAADAYDKCKVEVVQKPAPGYQLTDGRGLLVRRILDTNGDGAFDQWSYYLNGQEVYRDFDTKSTGKPNNFRWFLSGGSRWGVDENGDGKIDRWKSISAEEASAEAVAAIVAGDFERMKLVLLADEDAKSLGIDEGAIARVKKAQASYQAHFQQVAGDLPKTAVWSRLDKQNPMTVPAADGQSAQELVVYSNATIIAEAENQPRFLRTAEIVKVGDAWKLTDVPAAMDPAKPSTAVAVLIPAVEQANVAGNPGGSSAAAMNIENNAEVQQLAAQLEKHDAALANLGEDPKAMASYHKTRHDLCGTIAAKSSTLKNREFWYKQAADSLNAAVQTGEYKGGVEMLNEYSDQFAKVEWGKNLAPYFKYRAINATLGMELQGKPETHEKAQANFMTQIKAFVAAFPAAEDTADALWQLGNGLELSAKEDEAAVCYKKIVNDFAKSRIAAKATGALRRMEAVGKALELAGGNLMGGPSIDAAQFRGKVVVVSYWATFCEPCKAEMPRLEKLRQRYGDKGLEVLGVCLDQDKASGKKYIADKGYAWPQLHEDGSLDSAPAVQYGIVSLPYLMIVGPDGQIVKKNAQFTQLESDVEALLARKLTSKD